MTQLRIKNPIKDLKISYQNAYSMLLAFVWMRTSVISYVFSVIKRIPLIGAFSDGIKIALYIIVSLLGMPYIVKRLKALDYCLIIFALSVYVFNILIYEKTSHYLIENAVYILAVNFSVFFVGLVMDKDEHIELIYRCSQISIVVFFLFFVIFGFTPEAGRDNMENMGLAYRILPHVCVVSFYVFKNKKIKDFFLSILGGVLVLACGVRGAILSLCAFLIVYVACFYKFRYKGIYLTLGACIIMTIFSQFDKIAPYIMSFLNRFGLSTRVIETILEGSTLEDAPRRRIREWMIEAIQAHPYRGYGIAGDRNLIPTVVYAHSFWLEMWVSFGVIIGTLFMIGIAVLLFKALRKSCSFQRGFIVAMIFGGGLFKLVVSSSFLLEFEFFMLLGYCVGIIRRSTKGRITT